MPDMLVKLYELTDVWVFLAEQQRSGITIRKPLGCEKDVIVNWARERFNDAWRSEVGVALSNRPVTCFVAVRDGVILGLACYDASALGYFGPTWVEESWRGKRIGRALLLACLRDMKLRGYGYAVIGSTERVGFYRSVAGAMEIPDSSPGIWKTRLIRDTGGAG